MRKNRVGFFCFFLLLKMSDLGEEFAKICIQWPKKAQSLYSSTSLIRPPFIRISLLSGRDLAVIFFCVYNNYGEKGDFKLNQNSYTNSHELHIIPNIHTFTSNFLLNNLHSDIGTPLGRQLRVLNIESPISGQIPYPDERRSRHGRIREVELYMRFDCIPPEFSPFRNF